MTVNLRAMTYNIHSGFGRHGHDLHTILRVIEPEQVDLVALQEVDFALRRSGYVNQAQWLADRLSMHAIIGGTRRQGRIPDGPAWRRTLPPRRARFAVT